MKSILKNSVFQHVLFWIAYWLFWSVRDLVYHDNYFHLLRSNGITTVWYALGVYINLYWLIPKFLFQKKYISYGSLLTMVMLVMVGFVAISLYIYFSSFREEPKNIFFVSVEGFIFLLTEIVMLIAITTVLYLLKERNQKDRRLKELENKNLKSELSLLKSQMNPHFLFNALNSVYVLIKENQEKARETLARISDMLSHQLYDGSKEKVALEKEVQHVKNYVEMEKIRQGERVKVNWNFKGESNHKKIVPMLLIPFVENAFKHSLKSGLDHYEIDIEILLKEDLLHFHCRNQYRKNGQHPDHGGLGLENVKRRLELLYPGRHQLKISHDNDSFDVGLEIDLHEN